MSSFQTLVCLSSVMSSFQAPVRKSAATCFPDSGSSACCAFPDSGQYVCCYVIFSDSDLLVCSDVSTVSRLFSACLLCISRL
jgi:hypothetical protein